MSVKRLAISSLTACALSIFAPAGLAVAQPMEHGWHHGGPGEDMEFLRGLDLTDAQKAQVHTIIEGSMKAAKPLMEQMHTLHEQHITLLLTAGSTKAQLADVLHQEENVRNQLDQDRLATALQLRGVLTSEQLAQAADLHSKLEALHEQEHEAISAARSSAH